MLIVFVVEPVDMWKTPKLRQGWLVSFPHPHGWGDWSRIEQTLLWMGVGEKPVDERRIITFPE